MMADPTTPIIANQKQNFSLKPHKYIKIMAIYHWNQKFNNFHRVYIKSLKRPIMFDNFMKTRMIRRKPSSQVNMGINDQDW